LSLIAHVESQAAAGSLDELPVEKNLDALERNLDAVLGEEFVTNRFPGLLGRFPLVYLIEMSS
jgi:hypothetical protein